MSTRVRDTATAAILALAVSVAGVAPGAASTTAGRETTSKPVLSASTRQVEEGDRFTLTATVKAPKAATRATLQKWYVPLYIGTPSWQPVKTANVSGRRKVAFKAVATAENTARYRVSVAYKNSARPVTSNSVNVTVWRWIPLSEYAPYYETGGAIFGTAAINGHVYKGWGAAYYSHAGAWESRFTPGRHCKSFRAVLGIADVSADGSSGSVSFTADDETVYTSPALTPGMSLPVTVPLAKPYRFGIKLSDTTPGGTTGRDAVESWPFLGDPAFLCTGV